MTAVLAAQAGRHARPGRAHALRLVRPARPARPFRWYRLPLPLAALFAVAMPWVAVREVRQSHTAFKHLCDVMIVAHERGQLGQRDPEDDGARPRPRHLYVVK